MKILISLSANKDTEVDRLKRSLRVRAKYDTLKAKVDKLVARGAAKSACTAARQTAATYMRQWKCTVSVATLKKRIAAAMKRVQKLKPAHGQADLSSWEDDVQEAVDALKAAKAKGADRHELDMRKLQVTRTKALLNGKRKRMAAKK